MATATKNKKKRKRKIKRTVRPVRTSKSRPKAKLLKIIAPDWNPKKFRELGRGGEAAIYLLKPDTVAKVFLQPADPEFNGNPQLQAAAKVRIKEMQTKLLEFPGDLPPEVVTPTGLLIVKNKKIFGYVMPLIEGISLDKLTRTDSRLTPQMAKTLLLRLHTVVSNSHAKGVIIGDFNENNIIVSADVPYLIDADSMQFGGYQCKTFTPRFTAPEILKIVPIPDNKTPTKTIAKRDKKKKAAIAQNFLMAQPHNELTDWYAYLVIAMRLLTFTDPYGGVAAELDLAERIKQRITVFDQRVTYPLIARPLKSVPRPILEIFFRVFHRQERLVPKPEIFESLSD